MFDYKDKNTREIISRIKCFALDMDGTVYLGSRWIDGARDFLDAVISSGREYFFLTNNSSKDPTSYVNKLDRMGLKVGADRIITSGDATIDMLKREYPMGKIYLLGNELLQKQFMDADIELVNDMLESKYTARGDIGDMIAAGYVNAVVTGFDTSLDYNKLCVVCDLIRAGLPYIATHPDINCPTETGFIPDTGAMCELIYASVGRRPDIVIGKPNAGIMDYMLARTGYARSETAMVGDRLYTDVAAGVRNGICGILVLSGEASAEDIETSDVKPDLVFDSVYDIIEYL